MAAPSSPGGYVGEHQNGYFWNGTSWEGGPTIAAAPSTAFGGTIINQQAAPAPTPSSSRRASILATIMRGESGGRNVTQGNIGDINNRTGDLAQGYYQITGGTWNDFGGGKTGHTSAINAPYATQLQVAQNIPVARWGPATQEALRRAGYEPKPGETLGQMLARYNEDPTSTRPEDVGGSSDGGTAVAATTPTTGLLALDTTKLDALRAEQAATAAAQAAAAKDKEQEQAFAGLQKTGLGLLAEGQKVQPVAAAPPPLADSGPAAVPTPYEFATEMPDFRQMMMQQRLRRV